MASINVDKMSLKELRDLQGKVEKAITAARQRERAAALKKAEAAAASAGFSLSELLGGRGRGRGKSKSAAKYANPDNPSDTWTGRGRKPNWLNSKLSKGAKLQDFAI